MKLTTEQLKQIIKEELEAVMQEQERQPVRTFYKMGENALQVSESIVEQEKYKDKTDYEFSPVKGDGIDDMHLDVYNSDLDEEIFEKLSAQFDKNDDSTKFGFFEPGERAEY
jgi:hypothetical protein